MHLSNPVLDCNLKLHCFEEIYLSYFSKIEMFYLVVNLEIKDLSSEYSNDYFLFFFYFMCNFILLFQYLTETY